MNLSRFPASLSVAVTAAILSACAPLPSRTTIATAFEASPNFDARRPNLVVLHHTSDDTVEEALRTLTSPERKVSSHYLIGRDGRIVQLVQENERAWHAGESWWSGITDINSISLGIELDNNGYEPFPEVQIDALLMLLADIRQRYPIPDANFIGHADIAPTRKADPSELFPWKRLADQGFGLWCETTSTLAPPGFDLSLALTAIGYDPRTPEASRQAFRLHFMGNDPEPSTAVENAVAYCLLQKKGFSDY